ncbi:hypothetical protein KIP88_20325 [Bradyrhizobium sp. SRL28]|uniref:hypothetical protein n=1 Tax=Bradyrhizobium sp. SRL28 TaxID=2836178 RepID=UPI001BDE5FBB|nr:hypothetical protein [Bradyrhizobium sp. SRL28]MBT1512845.1 hypothetical protein [Bradyrhizobium sp. SRL28]
MTLLFAMYAREVAKALPSNKAYPPRGTENALRARLTVLGLVSGFGRFLLQQSNARTAANN